MSQSKKDNEKLKQFTEEVLKSLKDKFKKKNAMKRWRREYK